MSQVLSYFAISPTKVGGIETRNNHRGGKKQPRTFVYVEQPVQHNANDILKRLDVLFA